MLAASPPVAFLPSLDLSRSEEFYGALLGLELAGRSSFAVVFRAGAAELRVTRVEELRPQPFTVFGWRVQDAHAAVRQLRDRGVRTIRYDGMAQDEDGVWATPSGDLIAWFHDPDENVLSITQLAADA